jgi:hypothetical protein
MHKRFSVAHFQSLAACSSLPSHCEIYPAVSYDEATNLMKSTTRKEEDGSTTIFMWPRYGNISHKTPGPPASLFLLILSKNEIDLSFLHSSAPITNPALLAKICITCLSNNRI